MGVLNMGLSILSVDAAWQMAIKGLVLLLAVAFDIFNKRSSGEDDQPLRLISKGKK